MNFGMEHSDDKEKSKSSTEQPQPKKRKVAKAGKEDVQNDGHDARENIVTIAPYWKCEHVEAIRPFDSSRTGGNMPAQDDISRAIRGVRQTVEEVCAYTKDLAENELADFHEFKTKRNRRNVQSDSDPQLRDDEPENGESEARKSGEKVRANSEEGNESVGNEDIPGISEDSRGKNTIHLEVPEELESNEMAYFTPIGENVKGNDEMQCRNAPLLGEDTDDMAIGRGLCDKYPNGIHGYEPDKYEFSYQMLFDVMLKMLPSTTRETAELFYYSLYHLFPNFGSQEEMAEIFPKLARAYASSKTQLEDYLALESWKEGVLRNKDTEKKPFNYKHPCSEKHHFVKTMKSSSQNPCSESCFKNTLEQDILLEWWIDKSTEENCDFLKELVLKDDKNNIENFCEIASLFATNNCSEWFKFASSFSSEHDQRRMTTLQFQKRCRELLKIIKNENLESHEHDHESQKHNSKKNIVSLSPCCHFGPCGPNNPRCSCNGLCSVYCQCDYNCNRKFLGCRCTSIGKDCALTDCICVRVGWECIESTCKKCYCDSSPKSCRNSSITKMDDKTVIVRKSSVAGNGAFIDQDLEVDDFIGLYTGEVLSAEESERRGRLYELGCSYLFELSDTGISVDAGRAGNALRFVNHGCEKIANCYPIRAVVHGKELIGFFAAKKIKAGDELMFNYFYDKDAENRFFRSAPHERVPIYNDAVAKRVLGIKKDPNQPGTSNS